MNGVGSINFKALLREFVDKSEFEGIVLDYKKHTTLEMHEFLGMILDEYSHVFEDPYFLMDLVFRIARKNATDTKSLKKRALREHQHLTSLGKGDEQKFRAVTSGKKSNKPHPETDSMAALSDAPLQGAAKTWRKTEILFLAANPEGTDQLRLHREFREIELVLSQSKFGRRSLLLSHWAIHTEDLQRFLLERQPNIVHFCGHGSTQCGIILEDPGGGPISVPSLALGRLFDILGTKVRCVVLNACYSERQAEEISRYVDCVVGIDGSIGDESSIAFAKAFYRGLGYGKSVHAAFQQGCLEILFQHQEDEKRLKLICKHGIRAEEVILFYTQRHK